MLKKIPGMFKRIPENVQEDSGECSRIFRVMFKKIPGNVQEDSGECSKRFRECSRRFLGMLEKNPGNLNLDLFCEILLIFHQILQLNCDRTRNIFYATIYYF